MRYQRSESLKKHTSFRIGGPADYFCVPKNREELKEALGFAREKKLKVAILGSGTNILVLDQGFKGMVIKLGGGLQGISYERNRVKAGAGVPLAGLIKSMAYHKLGGLEFLAGIPGTVGGAVVMNAGAWGSDISRCIEEIKVLDKAGNEKALKKSRLKFGYRRSRLQEGNLIVTEVVLKGRKKKRKLIQKKISENLQRRRELQPLGIPNCGSVFKNPKGDFAGRLIEAAGFKGTRIGDAQVSSKHANFIVNLGDAKAKDVLKLMTAIQKAVKVKLEPELKLLVER